MNRITRTLSFCALMLMLAATMIFAKDNGPHTSGQFAGAKANTGTVAHWIENGRSILRVSSDFKVPDTPAPTWRVVDSNDTVYTLAAFKIKGGEKREVEVPAYVPNIAKVQVYCAWAEVLLGEANYASPVK
jgi:hypothetical protein